MTYSLFREGRKPAYLCSIHDEFQIRTLKEEGYPHTPIHHDWILFFANDRIKQYFLEQSRYLESDQPEFHQLIGVILGYPPMAAKFFADCMRNPDLQRKRAGFHYAGMNFVGNFDDRDEIAQWCWSRIPITPEKIEVTYQGETFQIFPPKR